MSSFWVIIAHNCILWMWKSFSFQLINSSRIYDFSGLSQREADESGGSKSNAIVVDYHPLTQWSEFHQSCRRHTGQCTLSEICISNPIFKCDDLASRTFKVNIVHEPCAKCFEVHILKFEILQNIWKNKTKNIKLLTPPIAEIICVKNVGAIVVCGFLMK